MLAIAQQKKNGNNLTMLTVGGNRDTQKSGVSIYKNPKPLSKACWSMVSAAKKLSSATDLPARFPIYETLFSTCV